jgi:hypothetical protein
LLGQIASSRWPRMQVGAQPLILDYEGGKSLRRPYEL